MRNALDDDTRRQLRKALLVAAESECRAIVLTGKGGSFCAGGELKSMPANDPYAIRQRMGEMHDIVKCIVSVGVPVIAAVEGFAYGSGLSIAAACDFVVAARDARFASTFGRVGLMPDCGILWSLPRRVGVGNTKRICLPNAEVDATEAYHMGLVDELVNKGGALAHALEFGFRLSLGAPLAIAATKRMMVGSLDVFEAFLEDELREQTALFGTQDFSNGRQAFLAKQTPVFIGH